MREELATLQRWQAEAGTVVVATVTSTSRSAPRGPGACLGLHPDGRVVGSVSGGCVESAVVEAATEVFRTGRPHAVAYGISDDDAYAVGLTCGGTIQVYIRTLPRSILDLSELAQRIALDEPVSLVTITESPTNPALEGWSLLVGPDGSLSAQLPNPDLQTELVDLACLMLGRNETGLREICLGDERPGEAVTAMVESFVPRPKMLIFGAVDFAGALASAGRFLGYHVTVCDARRRFATPARFPDADHVTVAWPHRFLADQTVTPDTAICILTHDPKFDVPAIQEALRTPASYIGVMGSRRTHDHRLRRLREAGLRDEELSRLRSPIGLDLGARSPQETAISIVSELVMLRRRGSGAALSETKGPIHPGPTERIRPTGLL